MKNQTTPNAKIASGIFALILGSLITLGLFLLRYFNILRLNTEVILTPSIVVFLLAYADILIIILFLSPISFFAKLIKRLKYLSQNNN